jgi:hypothetical protein
MAFFLHLDKGCHCRGDVRIWAFEIMPGLIAFNGKAGQSAFLDAAPEAQGPSNA